MLREVYLESFPLAQFCQWQVPKLRTANIWPAFERDATTNVVYLRRREEEATMTFGKRLYSDRQVSRTMLAISVEVKEHVEKMRDGLEPPEDTLRRLLGMEKRKKLSDLEDAHAINF